MIQVKDYTNFDVPYDMHLPIDFWDDWWAVRINTVTPRSVLDTWCSKKWGNYHNALYMDRSPWFRFVGTDVWLFQSKEHALHFTLQWAN
jgi:hypothetical protein